MSQVYLELKAAKHEIHLILSPWQVNLDTGQVKLWNLCGRFTSTIPNDIQDQLQEI